MHHRKARAMALPNLVKCLVEAARYIQELNRDEAGKYLSPMNWGTGSGDITAREGLDQDRLITELTEILQNHSLDKFPELMSWASDNHDELNVIAQEHGFDIRFEPFDSYTFGVLAIAILKLKWLTEGKPQMVAGINKPGFRLDGDAAKVEFYDLLGKVLIIIPTQNGDQLWIMKHSHLTEGLDLAIEGRELIEKWRMVRNRRPILYTWDGVVLPYLNLDIMPDISWVNGLYTVDANNIVYRITQAFMQVKIKMNELGVEASSAAGIAVTRGLPRDHHVNYDSMMMLVRPGVEIPFVTWTVPVDAFADDRVAIDF